MLAAQDVRFARTIERVQRIVISELYKIAIVHLYAQGYKDAELLEFELTMTSPSTIYEQEKLTLYNTKVDLAKSMLEGKIMSRQWIFENIFNFNSNEVLKVEEGILQDQKDAYRMSQMSENGEDPADPRNAKEEGGEEGGGEEKEGGEKGGEKEGDEENPFEEGLNYKLQKEYDKKRKTPEVPKGGWPGAGRPKEGMKYNSHEHPRGYDPIGKVAWHNARNNYRNESLVGAMKLSNSKKLKPKKVLSETASLLDESNIIQGTI
jgi:hypothetical protein